jgi:hypothetical protein
MFTNWKSRKKILLQVQILHVSIKTNTDPAQFTVKGISPGRVEGCGFKLIKLYFFRVILRFIQGLILKRPGLFCPFTDKSASQSFFDNCTVVTVVADIVTLHPPLKE